MSIYEKELDDITELITKMALKGASIEELKRAIAYSKAVLDAKKSEQENDLEFLRNKFI